MWFVVGLVCVSVCDVFVVFGVYVCEGVCVMCVFCVFVKCGLFVVWVCV